MYLLYETLREHDSFPIQHYNPVEALANQWRTKYWKPEYLELEQLLSRGKRWWKTAVLVDLLWVHALFLPHLPGFLNSVTPDLKKAVFETCHVLLIITVNQVYLRGSLQ